MSVEAQLIAEALNKIDILKELGDNLQSQVDCLAESLQHVADALVTVKDVLIEQGIKIEMAQLNIQSLGRKD